MMFITRDDILHWRSEDCASSNDGGYVDELQQPDDTKEREEKTLSENLTDSNSVQDLTCLFSKLSLHDAFENFGIEAESDDNPFEIRSSYQRSKLRRKYFPSFWHFNNFQELNVNKSKEVEANNEKELSKYFSLHFKPLFSNTLGRPTNLFVYKSTNIGTECIETIWKERSDYFHNQDNGNCCRFTATRIFSSAEMFATNHSFIEPLCSFFRYRSRFAVFLSNLLARAGRLKENFDHFVKENVCIYEDSFLERKRSTTKELQTDIGFSLVRRVPSEKRESNPEEQSSYFEDSETVIEEHGTGEEGSDIENQGILNEIQESNPEQEVYSDEELTLVENLEQETFTSEHTTCSREEELTLVEDQEDSDDDEWRMVSIRDIQNVVAELEICAEPNSNEQPCSYIEENDGEIGEEPCLAEQKYFQVEEIDLEEEEIYLQGQGTYDCFKELEALLPELEIRNEFLSR